jgi:hypothetical protein
MERLFIEAGQINAVSVVLLCKRYVDEDRKYNYVP